MRGDDQEAAEPRTFYRLFVTDGGGHIRSAAREVHAGSDVDAIAQAVALVGQVAFELWARSRLVATVERGERVPDRTAAGVGCSLFR